MKKMTIILHCLIAGILLISTTMANAQDDSNVTHVVLVWLKEPGNPAMRKQFIEASRQLNNLPGIVNRHVGIVVPSDRSIVDDTFDVGVTVTLKDKGAMKAYMQHPRHKKIIEEKLKPLVNKIVAYDFSSL